MNQILSVEMPKNRNGKSHHKSSIQSILIVFAIILMIFGIGVTVSGAYSFVSNKSGNLKSSKGMADSSVTKPIITTERVSANIINIVVTHDKAITNLTYTINDEEPIQINGENKTEVQQRVELPVGNPKISVTAEDIDGITGLYNGDFEVEQKPVITLDREGNQIKITTESQINIEKITYYWDDNKEEAVENKINDIKNTMLIDALEGEHTLNIVAVDVQGNETKKFQKVKGVTKPKVEVLTDGKAFSIKATDDEELSKIEITLNSNEPIVENISGKEYSTTVNVEEGENRLMIKVYNKNGLIETVKRKFTKE